jgi:hypothetical protein
MGHWQNYSPSQPGLRRCPRPGSMERWFDLSIPPRPASPQNYVHPPRRLMALTPPLQAPTILWVQLPPTLQGTLLLQPLAGPFDYRKL